MPYVQLGIVGGGAFPSSLRGLAVDAHDRLYAAGDRRVAVFDGDGHVLRHWDTPIPAWSVAVAADGRVFVGEEGQLQIFDPGGRHLATWRHSTRLGRVTAIDFVADDVLAGDATGRAIRRFDRDGVFINDIGTNNRMQGLLIPNGVVQFAVDAGGTIHAANPGKHRIERYTPAGELLDHFGRFDGNDPSGFSGCCNPTNVAIAGGRIYVTEKADPRAKTYDADGRLSGIIASTVFDPNCKNMSIAVDSHGRVYVADTVRLQVLVFAEQAGSPS